MSFTSWQKQKKKHLYDTQDNLNYMLSAWQLQGSVSQLNCHHETVVGKFYPDPKEIPTPTMWAVYNGDETPQSSGAEKTDSVAPVKVKSAELLSVY